MTLFDEPIGPPAAPSGPLTRLRMVVAYDGAGFHGFAAQPGGVRTVAGALAGAIERVLRLPAPPSLTCAGRTDAGVHAWGQVVHFDLPAAALGGGPDLDALARRLVKLLAPAVVVRSVALAPPGFDARRSATARAYRYTVLNRALPDPFLHGRVWLVDQPLDVRAMQLASDPFIGTHDFTSFCRQPPAPAGRAASAAGAVSAGGAIGVAGAAGGAAGAAGAAAGAGLVREVLAADWHDRGEGILRLDISATAFCQQMVRSLVGTLVEVGLGKRRAGEMAAILRARDRGAAGTVAPAEGLCLWEVTYPPD